MDLEGAWAIGLFETTGSVTKSGPSPSLSLNSIDADVLERFGRAMDRMGVIGSINGPYRTHRYSKPYWRWRASGWMNLENFREAGAGLLGFRKRAWIDSMLAKKPHNARVYQRRRIDDPNRLICIDK